MGMGSLCIWRAGLIQRRETPPEMRGMFICPPPPPPWDRTLIGIFLISVVKSIYPESQDYFLLKRVKLKIIN